MEKLAVAVFIFNYLVFIFVVSSICVAKKTGLSAEKSIVFGPGLNPRIVSPARYIYVQAVDEKGKNFTASPGNDAFRFNIIAETNGGKKYLQTKVWIVSFLKHVSFGVFNRKLLARSQSKCQKMDTFWPKIAWVWAHFKAQGALFLRNESCWKIIPRAPLRSMGRKLTRLTSSISSLKLLLFGMKVRNHYCTYSQLPSKTLCTCKIMTVGFFFVLFAFQLECFNNILRLLLSRQWIVIVGKFLNFLSCTPVPES